MTDLPPSEPEHRALKFRPRRSLFVRNPSPPSPVEDLGKYERAGTETPDDYRHRMIINGAALVVTMLLIAGGIWIANSMAQYRKNQDCVLSGRRNCTPIEIAAELR